MHLTSTHFFLCHQRYFINEKVAERHGYNFFEKGYETTLSEPRFIDRGEVTANVFAPDSRILEINSKSGLYPLYMAYSIYRTRVKNSLFSVSSIEDEQRIWDKVVAENIFVICKNSYGKRSIHQNAPL